MEVMLSIGLLAVAALSLLSVFIGGLKLMQRSNEMATANDVAKSTLEAIKKDVRINGMSVIPTGVYTFDSRLGDPADSSGLAPFPPAPYPETLVDDQLYQVVVEGQDEGTRLKRVRVQIYWNDNPPLKLETLLHP